MGPVSVLMRLGQSKAFTIAEVLISVLLLVITMTASVAFFFNSSKLSGSDEHRRIAMELADSRMEYIKSMNWGSINNSIGPWSDPIAYNLYATENATVYTNGYKQVDLTTSWQEPEQTVNEQINLTTYIAP